MTDLDTTELELDFSQANTPQNIQTPRRQVQTIDMATNVKIVTQSNPYLAAHPELVRTIAASSSDPYQLAQTAGGMGGMMAMDKLQTTFSRLSPGTQRALYGKLSDTQQKGMADLGYQPPKDDSGWFDDAVSAPAEVERQESSTDGSQGLQSGAEGDRRIFDLGPKVPATRLE